MPTPEPPPARLATTPREWYQFTGDDQVLVRTAVQQGQPIAPELPTFDEEFRRRTPRTIQPGPAPGEEDPVPEETRPRSDIIGSMLGKEKTRFLNRHSDELVLPDTHIGVEVELEGVPMRQLTTLLPNEVQHYWQFEPDNSLHDAGCEFTFRNPMYGADVCAALRSLMAVARDNKFKTSLRTGIHVHMDARDISRHQLLGLLAYYIIFEPAIYAWVGEDRHANNFCVPWFKYEGAVDQAANILDYMRRYTLNDGVRNQDVIAVCDSFHRYGGLNLKSLVEYGSIEFRQLPTRVEYDYVRDWINILMSLKKAALDVPESTMTIIDQLNRRGLDETGRVIFGERFWTQMIQAEPHLLQEIREYALPNAVEFIQKIIAKPLMVRAPSEEMEWTTDKKKQPEHPGFLVWRKANYQKDLENDKENNKVPPNPHQLMPAANAIHEINFGDRNPDYPRPLRVMHGEMLPTMAIRGYQSALAPDMRSMMWQYRGIAFDRQRLDFMMTLGLAPPRV